MSSKGQLLAFGFSNDDLIYFSYTLKQIRSFQCTDKEKLHLNAAKLDWTSVAAATNVNNKVSKYLYIFNDAIINMYNIYTPIRTVKLKPALEPFRTDVPVRVAMRCRNQAFRCFRRDQYEGKI